MFGIQAYATISTNTIEGNKIAISACNNTQRRNEDLFSSMKTSMTSYHYSQILTAPSQQMKAQILQHKRDLLLLKILLPSPILVFIVHTYTQLSGLSSC